MPDASPRTAVVTDWLTVRGGAARVLESVLAPRAGADVHALLYDARSFRDSPIGRRAVRTSFLQRLPLIHRTYRAALPLMPLAIERLDMRPYDLVISLAYAVASGVLTSADQLHVSYVCTPMRYAWDLQRSYLEDTRRARAAAFLAHPLLHYLRLWDLASSRRPDVLVAASHYVARRIAKLYGRPADVVHPPVEVGRFRPDRPRDDFYLTVSRLVPYKKIDVLAKACSRLGRRLVIIGDGPERRRVLRGTGDSVVCLGWQPDEVVADHLERCRAFVFAADEDFGIAPVEALAAGAPVIAYGKGGVLETVTAGETGVFFDRQTPDAVMRAVTDYEAMAGRFHPARLRESAEPFGPEQFRRRFEAIIDREWAQFLRRRAARPPADVPVGAVGG
jgi:glycosyltransferase involved in cell wall biosynthesis